MKQRAQYLLIILEPVQHEKLQQLLEALAQWTREHTGAEQVPTTNGYESHAERHNSFQHPWAGDVGWGPPAAGPAGGGLGWILTTNTGGG